MADLAIPSPSIDRLGNAGATGEGKVIVYDPSSFYGHSEFDLAFREWPAKNGFPGLGSEFWTAYHWSQPREPGVIASFWCLAPCALYSTCDVCVCEDERVWMSHATAWALLLCRL